MRDKEIVEGLGELADVAERDHEVQMARADLYKIAKYAIKLHDMLKSVSEAEGIEGWQQSKITKAADYIGSVYHSLDYEQTHQGGSLGESKEKTSCGCGPDCSHCGGEHSMNKVGEKCECCGKTIKAVAAEGKFKSAAHRKAVHAAKASGKKKKKGLGERLEAKLAEKKDSKSNS